MSLLVQQTRARKRAYRTDYIITVQIITRLCEIGHPVGITKVVQDVQLNHSKAEELVEALVDNNLLKKQEEHKGVFGKRLVKVRYEPTHAGIAFARSNSSVLEKSSKIAQDN